MRKWCWKDQAPSSHSSVNRSGSGTRFLSGIRQIISCRKSDNSEIVMSEFRQYFLHFIRSRTGSNIIGYPTILQLHPTTCSPRILGQYSSIIGYPTIIRGILGVTRQIPNRDRMHTTKTMNIQCRMHPRDKVVLYDNMLYLRQLWS